MADEAFLTGVAYLASSVPHLGTFAVEYPAGTSQTDFGGVGSIDAHEAVINDNDRYLAMSGEMSVSFGSLAITVTNKSGVTWQPLSTVALLFDLTNAYIRGDVRSVNGKTGVVNLSYVDLLNKPTLVNTFNGRSGAIVPQQADYDGFFLTPVEGNALYQLLTGKNAASGYAGLDSDGKLLTSALPGMAITDTFVVASQAAMLALTAERGDLCIRSDINRSFALAAEPASTLANWKELLTPTDTVLSVAGLTGAITAAALKTALTLAKGDVGLGSVDNTSDAAKPVSTAQQAALNLKADKTPGFISAASYGVVGDGVTVNTVALQNALNAAGTQGGGVVMLPLGVVVSGAVTIPAKVALEGVGRDATVLQLDGSNPAAFVEAAGSAGASVALAADAPSGANSLTLVSTAGIAAGDYLQLSDGYSYTTTDASYKSGETVRVLSVASPVVQLYSPIAGSRYTGGAYTTGNSAKINKISPLLSPAVRNMTIAGVWTSTSRLVHFNYAIGAEISGVFFRDHGAIAAQLRACINSAVAQCSFDNLRDDIPNGFSGYGVALSGPCENIQVHDNSFSRCRHGFTTMGGANGFAHRVLVANNQCVDTSLAGIDTHDCADGVLIEGNAVFASRGSGMTIRSTNTVVKGNRVTNSGSHGIGCSEENLSNVSIIGNVVVGSTDHGISCGQSCPGLTIRDNEVTSSGQDGLYVFGASTIDSPGLIVRGNYVRNVGLVGTGRASIIVGGTTPSTNGIVEGNTVEQSSGSAAYGLSLAGITGGAAIDNRGKGTFSTAMFSLGSNVALYNMVIDGSVGQVQMDPTTAAIRTTGSAANIDLLILPKGAGVLRFGTWTSGSGAANGYVSIKDAGGAVRKLATIA